MGEAEEGGRMGLLICPVYYFLLDGLVADLFLIYFFILWVPGNNY